MLHPIQLINMEVNEKTYFDKKRKAETREVMKSAGFFDGRFRQRTVENPKFKKPKHKKQIFE